MPHEIAFTGSNVNTVISGFADYFKTKVIYERAEKWINIPSAVGSGIIGGIDFHDGISVFVFSCQLKKDLHIRFKCNGMQPLRLLFCVENDFKHVIREDRMQYQLTYLLGSMVSGTMTKEQMFLIPSEKQIYYYCIEIDRQKYSAKVMDAISTLPQELREVMNDHLGMRPFLYQGHYSLIIAQCIQNIKNNTYKGLVRRVYIESQTLEIMAMQIKQYMDDMAPSKKQSVLRKRDMELIIEARNRLLNNLIKPPTIRELAHLTGTNENKLKKGFRLLYNTSINKLLQNERLSKAKLLIAEEAYPIKEIAKMVGYRHSGHFTSKFKKKFGVLPKEYIKTMSLV
jgi:AraC family transcriptional regulator, transcriptional activator of the genes for pyochelin and ferripyochelin receptors